MLTAPIAHMGAATPGERRVLVAHAFVSGGLSPTLGTPPASAARHRRRQRNNADFVALGHLHRPQSVGLSSFSTRAHPCGTPSRSGYAKSFTRIELDASGTASVSRLPVHPRATWCWSREPSMNSSRSSPCETRRPGGRATHRQGSGSQCHAAPARSVAQCSPRGAYAHGPR